MNRVMLAYLVCPQRWQSTTGNQKWLGIKQKLYFEAYNFLLMQNNLNLIFTQF